MVSRASLATMCAAQGAAGQHEVRPAKSLAVAAMSACRESRMSRDQGTTTAYVL